MPEAATQKCEIYFNEKIVLRSLRTLLCGIIHQTWPYEFIS